MTSSPAVSSAAPPSLAAQLAHFAADIKLSHSVFAMPFAVLAAVLAADHTGQVIGVVTLLLVVVCMVLARTVAMGANRWADRHIDAGNPRTAGRALPSGAVSSRFVLVTMLACAGGFVVATWGFYWLQGNPWPLLLSPAVLAWLAGYSFAKRFTWLCHIWLGSALALSPIAAAIAVAPGYLALAEPWLLAAMVLCWVAGFDIIYALQDVAVDQKQGLHSMPSRLGVERALWISRGLHGLAVAALVLIAMNDASSLRVGFAAGVVVVAGLLVLEHTLIWRSAARHIHMAFFTLNGIISILLGALGVADILLM